MSDPALLHGGPDALGAAPYDFSTNANACGPCPAALDALRQADRSRYPDPAYTALHARLAAFHGVPAPRIVLAASASEFIHRITAFAARGGLRHAVLPAHGYGDYARQGDVRVIDRAYAPLRLEGAAAAPPVDAWQLWSPNKALGLTGVRAAYAIAPGEAQAAAVQALAPSWPLGADGVALLQAWTGDAAQAWLAASLATLRAWKAAQVALCASLGWAVLPGSLANFFTARPPAGDLPGALQALRAQGIKLRDCASFGLSGHVRLGVLAPPAQQALAAAWRQCVA